MIQRRFIGNFPCLFHYERMKDGTLDKIEYRELILSICKHHGVPFKIARNILILRKANQQVSDGLKEEEYDSYQEKEMYGCSYLCNLLKNNIMCNTCLLSSSYDNDNYDYEIQLIVYVLSYGTALTSKIENLDFSIALRSTLYLGEDYSDWLYCNFTYVIMQILLANEEFVNRKIDKDKIDTPIKELCALFYKAQHIEERYDPERGYLTKVVDEIKNIYQAVCEKQQGPKKTPKTIQHEFMDLYHKCCLNNLVQELDVPVLVSTENELKNSQVVSQQGAVDSSNEDANKVNANNEKGTDTCEQDPDDKVEKSDEKDTSVHDETGEKIIPNGAEDEKKNRDKVKDEIVEEGEEKKEIPYCDFDKNVLEPLAGDIVIYPETEKELSTLDYELLASERFSIERLHVKNERVDKDCLVIYIHKFKKYYVLDCDNRSIAIIIGFYLKSKRKIKYTFSALDVYQYCDSYSITIDNILSIGYILNEEKQRHGDTLALSKFFLKRCVPESKIQRKNFERKLFYMMKYYVYGVQNLLPNDNELSEKILKSSQDQCHFEHLLSLRKHLLDCIDFVKDYDDYAFINFKLRDDVYGFFLSDEAKKAKFNPKKSCVIYTIFYGNDNYESRFFYCYYLFCIKLIKSGFWMNCLPMLIEINDKKMKILVEEKNHNQAFTTINRWLVKIARTVFDDIPIVNIKSQKVTL